MMKEGHLGGAGIDVFESEPPKLDNPLLKNNKVFLKPLNMCNKFQHAVIIMKVLRC